MADIFEDSIKSGLDYIKDNPGLTYEFSASSFPGQDPMTAFVHAANDAARALDNAIEGDRGHSGATFNMCLMAVLSQAKELGYDYIIDEPDTGTQKARLKPKVG